MRDRLGPVLLAAAMLLTGCMSASVVGDSPTRSSIPAAGSVAPTYPGTSTVTAPAPADGNESSSLIYGLVTASDDKGMVASYIGGACDGEARLAVTETASRIDVDVLIGPDPQGPRACPAIGYGRTVAARLAQPIGHRLIYSGAHRQVPFDGSRRLVPSALPPQFTKTNESFGGEPASDPAASSAPVSGALSGVDETKVTTRWTVTYAQPQLESGNRCVPTAGLIEVNVGPANADDFADGWSPTTTVSLEDHQARLWRQGGVTAPTGWAYQWNAGQGSVEVVAQIGCEGDRILDPTKLLDVARSLTSVN